MPDVRTPRDNTMRRLNREAGSCIVSYTRADGLQATTVGVGKTLAQRVADADSQLPRGVWLRDCVSTPGSVYGDLCGASTARGSLARHEGQTVERPHQPTRAATG